MKEKFLKQAKHEYSPGKRIIALMIEGVFFLSILPGALVYFSPLLDRQFELPSLAFGVINIVLGCGFVVAGILFAWWAIYVQFTIGRGTPVPINPIDSAPGRIGGAEDEAFRRSTPPGLSTARLPARPRSRERRRRTA